MFVVIEGIDGSGKGTVTKELALRLQQDNRTVETISFPRYEETLYGKLIGRYLNGEFGGDTHPFLHGTLYTLDRYESKSHLKSMIANNDFVLSDRYIPSNLCYSAAKARKDQQDEVVKHFVDFEYGLLGMPVPDVLIFLDMPVSFAVKNIANKSVRGYTDNAADLYESDTQLLEEARAFYLSRLMQYHPKTIFKSVECIANNKLKAIDEIVEHLQAIILQLKGQITCVSNAV
jgi:dTMP kinase